MLVKKSHKRDVLVREPLGRGATGDAEGLERRCTNQFYQARRVSEIWKSLIQVNEDLISG
jgi:hypothetical protein